MSPASDESICRYGAAKWAGKADPAAAAGPAVASVSPPAASAIPPAASAVAVIRASARGRRFVGFRGVRIERTVPSARRPGGERGERRTRRGRLVLALFLKQERNLSVTDCN